MYSLAFHAFHHVGEYTVTEASAHVILFEALTFQIRGHSILSCNTNLTHYKHSLKLSTLNILRSRVSAICRVEHLVQYCRLMGTKYGPLFLNKHGSAISSGQFSRVLRISIQDLGLPSHLYTPHSFRIGGASFAQQCNYSESLIQSLGRWKSSEVHKYLCTPMLSVNC